MIFEDPIDEGLIMRNPAARRRGPEKEKEKVVTDALGIPLTAERPEP